MHPKIMTTLRNFDLTPAPLATAKPALKISVTNHSMIIDPPAIKSMTPKNRSLQRLNRGPNRYMPFLESSIKTEVLPMNQLRIEDNFFGTVNPIRMGSIVRMVYLLVNISNNTLNVGPPTFLFSNKAFNAKAT